MITIERLQKSFGAIKAVDGLSFEVSEGSVVAFLGPNGAGKTTTMRMMAQVFEPDGGQVLFDGVPITTNPIAAKAMVGYLPENNPLDEDMLVAEYLDAVADLRGLDADKTDSIQAAVKKTGIESVYWRPIGELSKGFRQRVGLAQAILANPRILILDEPTEGLDPNQRQEIRALIRDIGRERTVIISTHVLQEVEAMATRVIIISHGRLVSDSSVEELAHRGNTKSVTRAEFAGSIEEALLEKEIEGVRVVRTQPTQQGRVRYYIESIQDIRPQLMAFAKKQNLELWELSRETVSLEDVFRELTK